MPDYPLYYVSTHGKLGCAQIDANTANLRQRSNHLGVQAASTIYDLRATVLAYPEIMELMAGDANLRSLIDALQLQVLGPTGHLAQVINNLRAELQSDIADEHARIDNLISQVNSLQVTVAGHTTQIAQHTSQISNLSTRLSANDTDNQALWSAIGGVGGLTGRVLPRYTGPVRSTMFMLYMDNTRYHDVHTLPVPYPGQNHTPGYPTNPTPPGTNPADPPVYCLGLDCPTGPPGTSPIGPPVYCHGEDCPTGPPGTNYPPGYPTNPYNYQRVYWGLPQMVDFGWVRYMHANSDIIDFGTLADRFAAASS
jgi:hypothetical protein